MRQVVVLDGECFDVECTVNGANCELAAAKGDQQSGNSMKELWYLEHERREIPFEDDVEEGLMKGVPPSSRNLHEFGDEADLIERWLFERSFDQCEALLSVSRQRHTGSIRLLGADCIGEREQGVDVAELQNVLMLSGGDFSNQIENSLLQLDR